MDIHNFIDQLRTQSLSNINTNIIIKKPSKEILIQMLQKEESIRFSPEYIAKCTEVASEPNGWLRISADVQKQIASEFGYISEIENDIAINHMRRAQYIYPDEPLFKTISVYVRNNLATKGNYLANDIVPDITLHQMENSPESDKINLYQTFDKLRPNILIASSHT
jgi:hypothetical protein